MERKPAIYMVTNRKNGTVYTGVTSHLQQRTAQHKAGTFCGFAKKYNCTRLVYYECFDSMQEAIMREKQIKGFVRRKKIALIESFNPSWEDLYDVICS